MLNYKDAQNNIKKYTKSWGVETVSVENSLGRVLAENIISDRDYPPFNRSTMDGYAIKISDFEEGIFEFHIIETLFAGQSTIKTLNKGTCYKIMTGAAVPDSADTVIRREDATENEEKVTFNLEKITINQNIHLKGKDSKHGNSIVSTDKLIDKAILGALAVVGKTKVSVKKLPRTALFSTGDEVVPIDKPVSDFQIRNSNAFVLEAMLSSFLIKPDYKSLLPDNEKIIEENLLKVIDYDLIILSGGVSAGDADFIPKVLQKIGVIQLLHKVAIRPGKPLWVGLTPNGGLVFGLPGNPISCQVTFKLFIEYFLLHSFSLPEKATLKLPFLQNRKQRVKLDEFFPCKIQNEPFGLLPLDFNTSGDVTGTIGSDGIAIQKMDQDTIEENTIIDFLPW